MKQSLGAACRCMLAAALLLGCAGPRHIRPGSVDPAVCRRPFAGAASRYVHALDAELPGGRRMAVIGVSVVDPAADTIHAALLSREGLTLFEASATGDRVEVRRAVAPFDAPEFAGRMLRDVRFIFLLPAGTLTATGTRDDGSFVCRYQDRSGGSVDLILRGDSGWEMERYAANGEKLCSLSVGSLRNGAAGVMELVSLSPAYRLLMRLISAERLSDADIPLFKK